ncbi:MAG: hypothetical protein P8J33_00775 [Pirellulaceae bacterium]|nr:hypothetical protein [Pirellulaceae bacterium]
MNRWQQPHNMVGDGQRYQNRCKSSPAEAADEFQHAMRHVAANALRVKLANKAESRQYANR